MISRGFDGVRRGCASQSEKQRSGANQSEIGGEDGKVIHSEITEKINNLRALLHSHCGWLPAAVTIVMKPSPSICKRLNPI